MCFRARERFLYYVNYVSKQTPQEGLMNNMWSECSICNKLYRNWVFLDSCLRDECAMVQQLCHWRMCVHLFNYKMSTILKRSGKMPELMGLIFEKICCNSLHQIAARDQTKTEPYLLTMKSRFLTRTKAFSGKACSKLRKYGYLGQCTFEPWRNDHVIFEFIHRSRDTRHNS